MQDRKGCLERGRGAFRFPRFVFIWLIKELQIISALHCRFPNSFTVTLVAILSSALSAPPRASLAALSPEQREKEDNARVTRQRPIIRVCSELALVGIIKDASDRSGAEWMMKMIKELVRSNSRIVPQSLNFQISCLTTQVYLLCHY